VRGGKRDAQDNRHQQAVGPRILREPELQEWIRAGLDANGFDAEQDENRPEEIEQLRGDDQSSERRARHRRLRCERDGEMADEHRATLAHGARDYRSRAEKEAPVGDAGVEAADLATVPTRSASNIARPSCSFCSGRRLRRRARACCACANASALLLPLDRRARYSTTPSTWCQSASYSFSKCSRSSGSNAAAG